MASWRVLVPEFGSAQGLSVNLFTGLVLTWCSYYEYERRRPLCSGYSRSRPGSDSMVRGTKQSSTHPTRRQLQ